MGDFMSARWGGGEAHSSTLHLTPIRELKGEPMTDHDTNPNVRKAVAFFTQAGLSRLLVKLRQKYIELGQIGGQVLLEIARRANAGKLPAFLASPLITV